MGGGLLTEFLTILLLVLANGFFAGAEIAILAAGRGRLQQQAEKGNRGAKLALDLAADPNRFLPTVQVGITLVGTFAAAFGGASLAKYLEAWLKVQKFSFLTGYEEELALTLVVFMIAFLSVVLGELVPKRMALQHANTLAGIVALPMAILSRVARPAVWVMARSTDGVLFLLGSSKASEPSVSVEDIQHLLKTGHEEGVLDGVERQVAAEALRLGDSMVKQIMRSRLEIDALEINTPPQEVLGALAMAGFSRLPVYEDNLDQIVGYVHLKDIVRQQYMGWAIDLRKLMHPALFVPGTLTIDRLLQRFQAERNQLAIVLDEFGGTEGMVTLEDVMMELVGEINTGNRHDNAQAIVQRDENSWLVDGQVTMDELAEKLHIRHPELLEPRNFSTVAGLVLSQLDRIPKIGESVLWIGWRFEVIDMDGPRIDRLMVAREPRGTQAPIIPHLQKPSH